MSGAGRDQKVDLSVMRFTYDSVLAERIFGAFGSPATGENHDNKEVVDMRRMHLLGDAVRITSGLFPEVWRAFTECLRALGIPEAAGHIYVQQAPDYNANVLGDGSRFDILIHSALLRDFSLPELRYVIGHELGHVLYKHSDISLNGLLNAHMDMPIEDARLLFRWSRSAEISADRVGLLCSGSLDGAIGALFKLSSGMMGVPLERIMESLQLQYDELTAHIAATETSQEILRTHPMSPIRFKALEMAAEQFAKMYSQGGVVDDALFKRLDMHIEHILQALESDASAPSGFLTQPGQKLLFELILFALIQRSRLDRTTRQDVEFVANVLHTDLPIAALLDDLEYDARDFVTRLERKFSSAPEKLPLTQQEVGSALGLAIAMSAQHQRGQADPGVKTRARDAARLLGVDSKQISYYPHARRLTEDDILRSLGVRSLAFNQYKL